MENGRLVDYLTAKIQQQDIKIADLTQQLVESQHHYCEKGYFIDKLLLEIESLKVKLAQISIILTDD